MRELARSIARERMKRAGYTKINKKRPGLGGKSFFAVHWREAVDYNPHSTTVKHRKKRLFKSMSNRKGLYGRSLYPKGLFA